MASPLRPIPLPRPRRRRSLTPQGDRTLTELIDHTLAGLATLVSARGLCARQAAALASLPLAEQDRIAAACQCLDCAGRRPH